MMSAARNKRSASANNEPPNELRIPFTQVIKNGSVKRKPVSVGILGLWFINCNNDLPPTRVMSVIIMVVVIIYWAVIKHRNLTSFVCFATSTFNPIFYHSPKSIFFFFILIS